MLPLRIYMMVLIPTECFYKSNWIEHHHNHCSMIKDTKPSTLLLGDSIVASLSRYLTSAILMVSLLYSKIMDGLSPTVPLIVLCSTKICSTSSSKAI